MFNDIADELERESIEYGELLPSTCNKLLDEFANDKAPLFVLTSTEYIPSNLVWLELIAYCVEMQYLTM